VFNRNKGESLSPADEEAKEGGHRKDYPVAFYDVTFSQFRYGLGEDHQPIPSDWAAGAEICFFSTKSCGQISLPFEIPSIDLTPKY
jgi:hypothetical protein